VIGHALAVDGGYTARCRAKAAPRASGDGG
jgi:hypothetical protein